MHLLRRVFTDTLLIITLLTSAVNAQSSLPRFFDDLFIKFLPDYQRIKINEYSGFCEQYRIDKSAIENQKQFFQINFMHDLFTGNGARNYVSGGILKIPYFWHWVNPNPRHKILFRSDSTELSSIDPPPGFERYKSFADVDRIPFIYLSDLVSETPAYFHHRCGHFYTFGWCSEREMAYSSLLTILGYDCKIKQEDIHTWSEIWVEFKRLDGKSTFVIAKVDNTFDSIVWTANANRIKKSDWEKDYGSGTQVEWYNKKAHSQSQLQELMMILVSENAQKRIEQMVADALE